MGKITKFKEVEKEIELTRGKLNNVLKNIDKSKITSEKILELSRDADEAILRYQKLLNKE